MKKSFVFGFVAFCSGIELKKHKDNILNETGGEKFENKTKNKHKTRGDCPNG